MWDLVQHDEDRLGRARLIGNSQSVFKNLLDQVVANSAQFSFLCIRVSRLRLTKSLPKEPYGLFLLGRGRRLSGPTDVLPRRFP